MSIRSSNQQYKYSRSVSRNHQNQTKILDQSNFMANYFNLPIFSRRKPCDQESIVSPVIRLKNYNVLRDSEIINDSSNQISPTLPQQSTLPHQDEYDDCHILSKRKNNRITNSQERENVSLRSKSINVRKQIISTEASIDYDHQRADKIIRAATIKLRSKTLAANDSVKNISKTDTTRTEQTDRIYNVIQRTLKRSNLKNNTNILVDVHPFKKNKRLYLEVQKSDYERLKIVFIFVRAAMRLSRKLRKTKKQIQSEQQVIQNLIDQHQQYVNNFRLQDIKFQQQKFVNIVSSKIIRSFESKKYIEECHLMWQKEENQIMKDIRRIRFCGFSMWFLKNLEFLTRPDYFPALLLHQMNLSLFNSKNKTTSKFVINRCQFYQKKIVNLSIKEKLIIASEFFFFEVIIPSLLELGNELDTESVSLKNQTHYYIVGMISLLQTLFTASFQKLPRKEQSKFYQRQRKLNVQIDKKTRQMSIKIEINKHLDDDETKILQGCFTKDVMQDIFVNKIKWTGEVHKLFDLILQNLEKQIQV